MPLYVAHAHALQWPHYAVRARRQRNHLDKNLEIHRYRAQHLDLINVLFSRQTIEDAS